MKEHLENLAASIIDLAKRLNDSGINQGTSGNISLRIPNGMLITPSSVPYSLMDVNDIVPLDFSGNRLLFAKLPFVGNTRSPSSEWKIHADLYKNRLDIHAILHCHSPYATAIACHSKSIPSFHYMVAVAGGHNIRCSRYHTFGTQELSNAVVQAMSDRKACLLAHHGQLSVGSSLDEAFSIAKEVETLAQIYLMASQLGEPDLLSKEEMKRVNSLMEDLKYGKLKD